MIWLRARLAATAILSLLAAGPSVAETPHRPAITDGTMLVRLFGKECAETGQVPAFAFIPPGQSDFVPVCTFLERASCQNRGQVLMDRGTPADIVANDSRKCQTLVDGPLVNQ